VLTYGIGTIVCKELLIKGKEISSDKREKKRRGRREN